MWPGEAAAAAWHGLGLPPVLAPCVYCKHHPMHDGAADPSQRPPLVSNVGTASGRRRPSRPPRCADGSAWAAGMHSPATSPHLLLSLHPPFCSSSPKPSASRSPQYLHPAPQLLAGTTTAPTTMSGAARSTRTASTRTVPAAAPAAAPAPNGQRVSTLVWPRLAGRPGWPLYQDRQLQLEPAAGVAAQLLTLVLTACLDFACHVPAPAEPEEGEI